jgi:hypothetical protein
MAVSQARMTQGKAAGMRARLPMLRRHAFAFMFPFSYLQFSEG